MPDNLSNRCDGTSGTTVSTANSGGPNQFDAVTLSGTGSTQAWDNAHVHTGSTSLKITCAISVATIAHVDWTTSISPTPVANAYARCYVYMTAYPTVIPRLINFLGGASVAQMSVRVSTTGTVQIVNEAASIIATTTAVIPLNAWCRIEGDITSNSGTTANLAARMFSGANLETSTPDSGGSISASAQTTTALVNGARFGPSASVTETAAWSVWFDDIAFSDTSTPGPSITPPYVLQGTRPVPAAVRVAAPQVITAPVSGAATGTAALSGSGTLTASPFFAGAAVLSGSGTLGATPAFAGTAALSGSGTLTAAPAFAGTATLSGTGTLTAGPYFDPSPVTLSGSGTLTAGPLATGAVQPVVIQGLVQPLPPRGPPSRLITALVPPLHVIQVSPAVRVTAAGPVTVTLGAPAGSGNTLVACITANGSTANPVATAITLGGSADNWRQAVANNPAVQSDAQIWYDPGAAAGQTSVVVTFGTAGSGTINEEVTVYEVAGVLVADQTVSANAGASTTWTSGATGTTSQPAEIFFGVLAAAGSATLPVATGTGTWTTQGASASAWGLSGFQNVSVTGTATYSGTQSSSGYSVAVATFSIFAGALPGTAVLAGQGTLTASPFFAGTAVLSGSGALTAAPVFTGAATLSGSGTLTAAPVFAGTAALSGTGTLSAAVTSAQPSGVIVAPVAQPKPPPPAPRPQILPPVQQDFLVVVADMQPATGGNIPPQVVSRDIRSLTPSPALILIPGDVANDGTTAEYGVFDQYYGATATSPATNLFSLLRPVPGNHDHAMNGDPANPPTNLTAYDTYFGALAHSGATPPNFYSFDTPAGWHVIGFDSGTQWVGSVANPSATYTAVANDLAANKGKPLIAFWHHPRWSDGSNTADPGGTGDTVELADIWNLLRDYACDLVFTGHCHSYQRFPKFGKTGAADPLGIREFVVGSGGSGLFTLTGPPGSPARSDINSWQSGAYDQINSQWFGYLKLWLTPSTYSWQFISQDAAGSQNPGAVLDSGGPVPTNLSLGATQGPPGASLSGSGALTAAPAFAATAALSGSGSLTAAPALAPAATLAGTGTLTAAPVFAPAATLSGAGTLSAAEKLGILAALSGSGTLSAAITVAATASLSGAGTLTAAGAARPPNIPAQSTATVTAADTSASTVTDPRDGSPSVTAGVTSSPGVTDPRDGTDSVTAAATSASSVS